MKTLLTLLLLLLALPCYAQVSATANVGQRVTISVTADGTQPFGYQWYKGIGLTAGMAIAGETGPSYVIPTVKAADAGSYFVEVSNPAASGVQSETATLNVSPPPMTATLTANVTSTGYPQVAIYQWRLNGKSIPGANQPTYSFDPAVAPGSYSLTLTWPNVPAPTP